MHGGELWYMTLLTSYITLEHDISTIREKRRKKKQQKKNIKVQGASKSDIGMNVCGCAESHKVIYWLFQLSRNVNIYIARCHRNSTVNL